MASAVLVTGMNALLARASARGDISVVGPVFALSPVFTVIPDAVLSGTLPSPLGWLGLALSVTGTVSLSGGAAGRLRTLFARRDALDALGAAILLGFVAAVDRWGALAMGPPSYLVCSHGATALLIAGDRRSSSCRAASPPAFRPRNLVHPGGARRPRRVGHGDADDRAHHAPPPPTSTPSAECPPSSPSSSAPRSSANRTSAAAWPPPS